MAEKDDGGQAFPRAGALGDGFEGMSLRDYFAAHSGLVDPQSFGRGESSIAIDATRAYRWADALLKARSQS